MVKEQHTPGIEETERHTPDIEEQAEMPGGGPRAGEEGAPTAAPGESPADQAAAAPDSPEQLTALLEDARSKADEHWNALLRARAEIENLNRRHAREVEHAHKFALDGFVRELLQVRDSLELGHDAAQDATADVEKLREGTELTLKLLTDVMNKFGVQQISPMGEPFNPELHQAMTTQPRDDVPPNTVVAVVQKGYLLNGRLVRPALVMVSAAAG
jgi:molecular chaperone GrpE